MDATLTTLELTTRVGAIRVTFTPALSVEQELEVLTISQHYATADGLSSRIAELARKWSLRATVAHLQDVRAL